MQKQNDLILLSKDTNWSYGAMDNASDYGSEDCRFESC